MNSFFPPKSSIFPPTFSSQFRERKGLELTIPTVGDPARSWMSSIMMERREGKVLRDNRGKILEEDWRVNTRGADNVTRYS